MVGQSMRRKVEVSVNQWDSNFWSTGEGYTVQPLESLVIL